MDNEIIRTKLESLIRCIHRIKNQNVSSIKDLEENLDKQDIIILNLQRAIQICVDISNHILLDYPTPTPETMAESFVYMSKNNLLSDKTAENLKSAVDFRNIAVHQYQDIDCSILYTIVTTRLEDFKSFAGEITRLF